tara:strand:+ start:571 stop:1128 length:558 start_codon:yes stop_codon:yes gene_type:complete
MKLCEDYDKDVMGRSQITKSGEGGRTYADRKKTEPEIRRTKAVGGGKSEPTKSYKPRKDIGTQKPKSTREQQPEKERGSAGLSPKEAQRKAYKERKARESGAKTKTASELLSKKSKSKVDPDYKPQKASGYTHKERKKIKTHGEKILKHEFAKQETEKYKKATGQNPTGKAKTKVLAQVNRRMSS